MQTSEPNKKFKRDFENTHFFCKERKKTACSRNPLTRRYVSKVRDMKLSDIHFHDSVLNAVIENTVIDELRFDVDYPTDWDNNVFSQAYIVFSNVKEYEIHEIPFDGSPIIMGYEIISEADNRCKVKLNTNAGYRMFSYEKVDIEWPNNYRNAIEEQFYLAKRDNLVNFVINDYIKINEGELTGCKGSVISVTAELPTLNYLIELENGQGDIRLNELSFSLVEGINNDT